MLDLKTVLDQNYLKGRQQVRQAKIAQKQAERKEKILTIVISIIAITVLLCGLNMMTTQAQEKCVKAGHTNCSDLLK